MSRRICDFNRRIFIRSGAALAASMLWQFPALAAAKTVQPPYRYESFTHDVIDLCARYYGTTKEAVLSPLREKREVQARQAAMYIAKRLSQRSLPDLGRKLGGRDHTTVFYAVRKIERLIQVDLFRRNDIAYLTEAAHRVARIKIAHEQSRRAAS